MFPNPRPRFPITPILATGQTTSYGSGAGLDDGALRKGAAKSYTILTAGQYSGTTNITINSKTDVHTNECVLDKNTGLMWSRRLSASVGPASNGLISWTTNAGGEGVFTYCTAANTAGLAGHSDWRVPNVYELVSLADYEAGTGVPDATAFPSWTTSTVFSSTTVPIVTTRAFGVTYSSGSVVADSAIATKTVTNYCALVRG